MDNRAWLNDSAISHIPLFKLEFLQAMVFKSKEYSQKEMLPFLLSLASESKSKNITFTKEEMETIITVLKKHASNEDVEKMNKMIHIFSSKSK
ncbi:MAG: hypothetical protein ACRC7V_03395 [Lachnospiraceae bacterium]